METKEIIKSVINSKHGWAVADQFEDSWDGEDFEKQNYNALKYIKGTIDAVLRSKVFNEDTYDEIAYYQYKLNEYLNHD